MTNYNLSTATNGSLALDRNSNAVDMSTGTTQMVGSSTDNGRSATLTMPFTFYFWGQEITTFSANSNGIARLQGRIRANETSLGRNNEYHLAAFAGDLATSSSGEVDYKVIGSSPNRCLVIEWKDMEVNVASSTADATFQLRLYETTGIIEFVYGSMAVGTGGGTNDYNIGIQRDDNDNRYISVNANTLAEVRTGGAYNNSYGVGTITDLNSAANGSRVIYTFTSQTAAPATPTAAATTFKNIGCNSMDFYWNDNSTTETYFDVYVSTDNSYFEYQGSTQSTTTAGTGDEYSFSGTNLSPTQNYYFRAVARNESNAPSSNYDAGPQATGGAGSAITSNQTGNWNDVNTWVGGVIPSSCNDAIIASGHTVDIDGIRYCNDLTVNGTLQFQNSNNRYLYVGGDVTVNSTGTFTGATTNARTYLYLSGNLTVNSGNFNMEGTSAGTYVIFENEFESVINGTGGTCNFYELTIDKGSTATGYTVEATRIITIEDASTATPNNNKRLNILNGTFKISSASVLKPYIDAGQTICNNTAKLWLNNSSADISWVNNGSTDDDATFGDLQIDAGTFVSNRSIIINRVFNMSGGTLTAPNTGDIQLNADANGTITGGTLSATDDLNIYAPLTVSGGTTSISVTDDILVDNQDISTRNGTLTWSDVSVNCDDILIYGPSTVSGAGVTWNATNVDSGGDLTVTDNATYNGTLDITDADINCSDDFLINGAVTISGASSTITIGDDLPINDHTDGTTNGNLTFADAVMTCDVWTINGAATINSGSITTTGAIATRQYGVYPNGSLTMNNTATVTSQNGNITANGNITMTGSSVLTSGNGNDGFLVSRGKTVNISDNAIINHFGNMDFLNANGGANLIMAGSSQINLDPQHTETDAADDVLLFESTTTATCTGGTITFIDPNPNNTAVDNNTLDIKGTAGNMDFSGVNIQFKNGAVIGNGGAGDYGGFKIRSYATDITFADIIINNSGGANREVHLDRQTGQIDNFDFTCNNLTITAGTFDIEFHNLTVKGDITNAGNLLSTNLTSGAIILDAPNPAAATSYSGAGTYTLDNLTFNNTSGVTLNSPFGANTVNITDGIITTTTTNILTVEGTDAADLTGGSATAYVNGPLKRNFADNASATYIYPIGKAAYLPYYRRFTRCKYLGSKYRRYRSASY